MKNVNIWLAIASLASTLSVLFPAEAASPPDVFKDVDGNVYIHGTTANGFGDAVDIELTGNNATRTIRAGYCGELRLAPSTSFPNIGSQWKVNGGTAINGSSMTTLTGDSLPRCSGNVFTPAASSSFKDDTGRVYLIGSYSPGMRYEVEYMGVPDTRRVRENDCGFFRLSNSLRNPVPAQFKIGSTSYTSSVLPVAEPQLCRSGIKFTPETWD